MQQSPSELWLAVGATVSPVDQAYVLLNHSRDSEGTQSGWHSLKGGVSPRVLVRRMREGAGGGVTTNAGMASRGRNHESEDIDTCVIAWVSIFAGDGRSRRCAGAA